MAIRPPTSGSFKPGRSGNPAGKPKGCKSKVAQSVKEAIERAFETVGGTDYLVTVARDDPKTFCLLLAKIIPVQLTGDGGGPVTIQVVTGISREPGGE